MQNRAALKAVQTAERHADKIGDVTNALRAAEQHYFEIVAEQRRAARDFQIAPIIPDPADERKTRFEAPPIDGHFELSQRPEYLSESACIIRKLSGRRFQVQIDSGHNLGIQ